VPCLPFSALLLLHAYSSSQIAHLKKAARSIAENSDSNTAKLALQIIAHCVTLLSKENPQLLQQLKYPL